MKLNTAYQQQIKNKNCSDLKEGPGMHLAYAYYPQFSELGDHLACCSGYCRDRGGKTSSIDLLFAGSLLSTITALLVQAVKTKSQPVSLPEISPLPHLLHTATKPIS